MKNRFDLVTSKCSGCGEIFQVIYEIPTGDYDSTFCSEECAMIHYHRLEVLLTRKRKIDKILSES